MEIITEKDFNEKIKKGVVVVDFFATSAIIIVTVISQCLRIKKEGCL